MAAVWHDKFVVDNFFGQHSLSDDDLNCASLSEITVAGTSKWLIQPVKKRPHIRGKGPFEGIISGHLVSPVHHCD
jgi:hypothetical protein